MAFRVRRAPFTDAVHVYPTFGRSHIIDGEPCWCQPAPLPDCADVLVHNVGH
jgi:hypothetical protein